MIFSEVVIFSNDSDVSTAKVMTWLKKEHIKVIRVNNSDYLQIKLNSIENLEIIKEKFVINVSAKRCKGVWLRRGNLSNFIDYNLPENLQEVVLKEHIKLRDFIYTIIEKHPNSLGSLLKEGSVNKLLNLLAAKECGLTIPESFISTKSFNNLEKKDFLTKSMNNHIQFNHDGFFFSAGSPTRLSDKYKTDKNFPSLYQKEIKKRFEIRTFYLRGEFYSMAIFSQKNNKTSLDYRNYDKKKPNRIVPFLLPLEIRQKLTKLLNNLNLDTGSIDLIFSVKNEFVFLEVNPVGQFDWLSVNCNYQIEKKIAKILMEYNHE